MAERINPRPTTLNPARRFTVRLTLAAGATVATLVGSQTLALLEHSSSAAVAGSPTTASQAAVVNNVVPSPTAIVTAEPTGAAPGVTVIRNPGKLPTPVRPKQPVARSAQPVAGGPIAPPNPVVDAQPVQVQPAQGQPAPVSRSSR